MNTILTAALVAMVFVTGALVQWQPSGPIEFLIGFRDGGGADTMTGMLTEDLTAEYG